MNNYKGFLKDLLFLLAENYNDTLPNKINDGDAFRSGENHAFFITIDLIYQQLVSFDLNNDFNMPKPFMNQEYNPVPVQRMTDALKTEPQTPKPEQE